MMPSSPTFTLAQVDNSVVYFYRSSYLDYWVINSGASDQLIGNKLS